jgi:hypothetical protein
MTVKFTAECPTVFQVLFFRFHKKHPIELFSSCQDPVKDINPAMLPFQQAAEKYPEARRA